MPWTIDEREMSEQLSENLPDGWKVRVFHVTSGDSGKDYWVHLMQEGRRNPIALCNCPDATFKMPLVVIGVYVCKHARQAMEFIADGKNEAAS